MENLSYFGTVNPKSKKCYNTLGRKIALFHARQSTLRPANGVFSSVLN